MSGEKQSGSKKPQTKKKQTKKAPEAKVVKNTEKPKVKKTKASKPPDILAVRAPKPKMEPQREPRWDAATWRAMASPRLGYPAYIIDGALHGKAENMMYTEKEMINLIEGFLGQSL